ncbi:NAD(P)/FAD-dependent oxidoreductase [Mesorhizobium sp. IMUNJ 23232]|uniref:NAD(P)/FAD-dependent oxidoreductase n=1 Tax=Mesorhizobium sp. IMUNJ 23232 TaxID=3376064 RepID=UPI0037A174D3
MDDRPFDADVVVVGGGPAGSAAAIACATQGLRVVLCEREAAGRDRPGETLHPGVEPVLAQLGVADQLPGVIGVRHGGIWIEWGRPRRYESFGGDTAGPWAGFQVWRASFDAMLLEHSRALGVEVRERCAVFDAIIRDGAVCGVMTAEGEITTRMVVDASGAARWLARALKIRSPPRSPQLIARYGYVEGACPARDEAPLLVGTASGWTWTARVRPSVYQWTTVRFDSIGADEGPPEELIDLAPLGRTRGADVTWRLAERTAGPGWIIAGDAAAILDPTSSHGVLKGLLSGITAGHLIAAGLAGKAPPAELAAGYHSWIEGRFNIDAHRLLQFYREIGAPGF